MNISIQFKTGSSIMAALLSLSLPLCLHAQQSADTLAPIRQFIEVSSSYKQGSMYTDIQIKNSSNYITNPQDTATSEMIFYMTKDGAYMKYGELEQVVNDSLILMVNNIAKRMILVPNRESVQQHLNTYTGMLLEDSSIQKMAGEYTGSASSENNKAVIELASRVMAFGTMLPKEVLFMKYKEKNNQPQQVTQIKRVLVILDSVQYNQLVNLSEYKGRLLSPGKGSFFLVKDRITTFIYKKIEYGDKVQLPVHMSDRISANSNEGYLPAKGYEDFLLSSQN